MYKVLDCATEASTELRDLKVRRATTLEILRTFYDSLSVTDDNATASYYICGSQFEGTSLEDMNSDIDIVMVYEDCPVVTDISDAQQYARCFLTVQDPDTPAGYVKMQLVIHGNPQHLYSSGQSNGVFQSDTRNREIFTLSHEEFLPDSVVHGPARTEEETDFTPACDNVIALRCNKWPACATEWLTRRRPYNCPSKKLIDYFKTLGCFFVCVGHPLSSEKDKEWRLSFSLQERYLVSHFNSVQLKCYILLKIIKKELISKAIGENSLTSYHCKTCMLYMIESTPTHFWTADNFLICVCECLKEILKYVETGFCPNYFIPDENMFEGRLTNRSKLRDFLRWLLALDLKYLLNIKIAGLEDLFRMSIISGVEIPRYPVLHNSHIYLIIGSMLYCKNWLFINVINQSPNQAVKGLYQLQSMMKTTSRVTEHSQSETIKSLDFVLPHVEICLQSVLAVCARRQQKSNDFLLEILTSPRWHQLSLQSDLFSSKLKQASLLYACGHYQLSLAIVLTLEQNLWQQMSVCCCSDGRFPPRTNPGQVFRELSTFETLCENEFLQDNLVPCVFYLKAERDLTPPPLCYEKLSVDKGETWHDGAAVDGKILLYFLLYLNHQRFGTEENSDADVENIKWLIETDICLGHRETDLNILGWIYQSKGRVDQAVRCYQESLAVRPDNNPALMHMQNIVCSYSGY